MNCSVNRATREMPFGLRRRAALLALIFSSLVWSASAAVASAANASDVPAEARALFDKAEIAREESNLERAAQLYIEAIGKHALYEAAHVGYLATVRGIGDNFAAREFYADLVAKNADSIELKVFHAATLDSAESVAALVALVSEHSDNVRAKVELGRALILAGTPKKAISPLKAALKSDANNLAARTLLGDASLVQGKVKTAIKAYEATLELERGYIPARLRLALAMHRNKKSAKALESLEKLVSEDAYPNLVAAHWLLATIRMDVGKISDAIKSIDRVLAIDRDDADALFAKGILLLKDEKPGDAVKVFEKAVAKNARSSDNMFALAWSYEQWADESDVDDAKMKERLAKSAEAYEKCAGMSPGPRARDSLGFVYLLSNRHADAVLQFKRAADVGPKFASATNNLGLASDMADNRSEAKKKYELVLKKIDKRSVRAMVMLALDHWLDGATSKAIKGLKKAVKLDPKDDLAWTFLGDVYTDTQKWDSAIKAYRQATEINDSNFIAWFHMGQLYQDVKKKWEEADNCFRKAIAAEATPPTEIFLRIAEVNEEEGLDDKSEALKFYKRYKEAGGSTDIPFDWIDDRIEDLEDALKGK